MSTRIQLRRGTAAQWSASDPVLSLGEPGVEVDANGALGRFKVGDGVKAWSQLSYAVSDADRFQQLLLGYDRETGTLYFDPENGPLATDKVTYQITNGALQIFQGTTPIPIITQLEFDAHKTSQAAAVATQVEAFRADTVTRSVDIATSLATYQANPRLPGQPHLLSWLVRQPLLGTLTGTAFSEDGRYLFVNRAETTQMFVIDLIDPAAPALVKTYTDAVALEGAGRMVRQGNFLYIAAEQHLQIVNITDPLNATFSGLMVGVNTVLATGKNSAISNAGTPNDIVVHPDSNTVWICQPAGARLAVIDTTNKTQPSFTAALQDTTNQNGLNRIARLPSGRLIGVSFSPGSVQIYDVSNRSAAPVIYSRTVDATLTSGASFVNVQGTKATVTTGNGRVTCLDITNELAPVIRGTVSAGSFIAGIHDVARAGSNRLFMTSSQGSWVYVDDSNIDAPALADGNRSIDEEHISTRGPHQLAVHRGILAAPAGNWGRINFLGASGLASHRVFRTITVLGDSISSMHGSGTLRNSTKGWVHWFNARSGHKWQLIYNAGQSGQQSPGISERSHGAHIFRPAIACLLMGTNDFNSATITPEQTIANVRASVENALKGGSKVVVCTIIARTQGGLSNEIYARLPIINAGIRKIADDYAGHGVFLADFFATSAEGTTSAPKAGYTYDGLHLTSLGAERLSVPFTDAVTAATLGMDLAAPRRLGATNFAPNPTLAGDTGGVADNSTVSGFTPTKVAGGQQLVLGASATGTFVQTVPVTPGDIMVARLAIDSSAWAAVTDWNLSFTAGSVIGQDFSQGIGLQVSSPDSATNPIPLPGLNVVLQSFPIVIPAGITSAELKFTVKTAAGGSATNVIKSVEARSSVNV